MFSFIALFAQTKNVVRQWHIAGKIPPSENLQDAIGFAGPIAGVHKNVMLFAGGANFPDKMPWEGGKKQYYSHGYVFSKSNATIKPLKSNFELPEPIGYAATCSTPRGVFFGGGENSHGLSSKAYILSWEPVSKKVIIHSLPDMPFSLTNAAATSYHDLVFIAGGETATGVTTSCWFLDLNHIESGWQALPALPKPVSHAVFIAMPTAQQFSLYLFGGRCKNANGISEIYNTVMSLHSTDKIWKSLSPLPYALSAGTGVGIENHDVILFGGEQGTVFNQVERYLVEINKAIDPTVKEALIQQKNLLQSNHPGFSNEILLYDLLKETTVSQGVIPFAAPATTIAFWWNHDIIIPSGEIKAGVRTPHILLVTLQQRAQ